MSAQKEDAASHTESDRIFENILNSLPSGIIFCDNDCKIWFINRTYADYLGVSQKEVVGKPITDYIPGSRVPAVLETGQPELGFKCSVGEGKEKKVLIVNRIPVQGMDGSIIGVLSQSLFSDIGELKDLSERLDHLERKVSVYREKIKSVFSSKYGFDDIKGESRAIIKAKEFIKYYARTESPVLLQGPTGTGKEIFAHALHLESRRSKGPFVGINCAAIPQDLFESELFGYVPGAFTGAQKDGKMGQLELADKGSLFLDEIGEMPLHAQVKLLRVIEEKIVYRLGSSQPKKVDFRLIAATNRDLKAMIRNGEFREDLYYRLNTMIVCIPSLSDRKDDIPLLIRYFLDRLDRHSTSCSRKALEILTMHTWPGNVRELKNVIERAVSLCSGSVIGIEHLPSEIVVESAPTPATLVLYEHSPLPTLSEHERKLILTALEENKWNIARTAKRLDISRASLYEKLKKFQLSRPCTQQPFIV
jgi:PAS domain S-box-containing protein